MGEYDHEKDKILSENSRLKTALDVANKKIYGAGFIALGSLMNLAKDDIHNQSIEDAIEIASIAPLVAGLALYFGAKTMVEHEEKH